MRRIRTWAGRHSGSHSLMIVIGASLTSFSAVFVKLAHVNPDAAGFYRNFFGLCALTVLVVMYNECPVKKSYSVWISALCAFFFFLDLVVWHRSIEYLGPGLATLLGNFQVFILAAVSLFYLREKITFIFFISITLALAGLLLVVNPFTFTFHSSFGKGVVLGLLTSVCYAGYLITLRLAKKQIHAMSSISVMWLTSLFCSAYFFVETHALGESLAIGSLSSGGYLVAYGVISQCIGWVIITRSLPHVKTSIAGLLLLSQPALSYLWDIIIFGRPIVPMEISGVLVAFSAIYLGSRAGSK